MKRMLLLGIVMVMSMVIFAGCGQNNNAVEQPAQEPQVQSQQQVQSEDQDAQNQQGIVYEDGVAMNPADYDLISEEEAKQIALSKVDGAQEENLNRIDLDYDDRRWVYEGEIWLGDWEYEFEINAENGNIIGFEKDHIYD